MDAVAKEPREPQPPRLSPQADAHVQDILKTLPEGTLLRDALENDERGDGKRHKWIKGMQREKLRAATFNFKFQWDHGPRVLELEQAIYHSNYMFRMEDVDGTQKAAQAVTVSKQLDAELRNAALQKATTAIKLWMKLERMSRGNGRAFVVLFDDEWLPSMGAPYPDVTDPQEVHDPMIGMLSGCGGLWDPDGSRTRYSGHRAYYWPPPTPEEIEQSNLRVEAEIKKLIAAGANINAVDRDGTTPLIAASGSCPSTIVDRLLHAGAAVNAKDRWGRTPLILAVSPRKLDTVRLLLKAGAQVNARDNEDETPLGRAVSIHDESIVMELIAAKALVNTRVSSGWTILMRAAWVKSSLVPILLKAGADPNARDPLGNTALLLAARKNHPGAVRALLDAGADINAKNKRGETAISIARINGYREVIQLLNNTGAKQ